MGIMESVRAVMWGRRRQPEQVAYGVELGHERFSPSELLDQAVEAERVGFDIVSCSDHLAPWWEPDGGPPAHCANAWVWLGAAGQATDNVAIGPGVSAIVHRYNPVVMAQQAATLELMNPGRAFLAVGSGEAMNEVPAGLRWPSPTEQLARTSEALEIITGLLNGATVTHEGRYFRAERARIYDLPPRRVPVFMSAFGPRAATIAGRLADGIWTLAHPGKSPAVIAAYRRACERAGREPGEIVLQSTAAAAETDDDEISDRKYKMMSIISPDPDTHVRRLKMIQGMGATAVVIMNVSGADPLGTLRLYGEHVLPKMRG